MKPKTEQTKAVARPLEQSLLEIAKTPAEREQAFKLASQARQAQMIREAAAALAERGWGQNASPIARAAAARYMLEIGGDPVRHCFILGGSTVYLNAEFYRDLCANNPDFVRDEFDFIHDDERADEAERSRRKQQRIDFGVPEAAPGACVVTLHYRTRGPFVGVNWAGVRKNDPVGLEEPTKTAHSRAYRKAAMKAESAWFRSHQRVATAESLFAVSQGSVKLGERDVYSPTMDSPPVELPPPEPITANHNPSEICSIEGPHPATECGYEKRKSDAQQV